MKAVLVWPKFQSFSFWNFEEVCKMAGAKYMTPPLGLLTIAAQLPQEWDISLVDENVATLKDEDIADADLVFVGAKIVHRQRALEVVRLAKSLGRTVVVGGPDPTLNEAVYRKAGGDYLCLGEGELTIPDFLADYENDVPSGVYEASGSANLESVPPPRFDLINFKDYLYVGIQYSRGCPYHCEFCNVIDLFEGYNTKTVDQVLNELQVLYDLGYRGQVDFFDDNLVGNMKKAKPLLEALAAWLKAHKYPFQFSTSVTLNIAKDEELLKLMRAARFKYLLVGIETPSEDALKSAQKPQNMGFSIPEAVDRIYRIAGATVHSGFLLGLDGEPENIGDCVVDCIEETSIPWVMAGVVYPLPGTQLSQRLDREGRLFPKARAFDDENVRDQISAGIQFKPERPATAVLADLVRILKYSFDPAKYFARCASVARRLNTVPNPKPSWGMLARNLKIALRLFGKMTASRSMRWPFWKAFWKVIFRNPRGVEALVTLAVLFLHFQKMLPYCFEQLQLQKEELESIGENEWLRQNLLEEDVPAHVIPPVSAQPSAPALSA